MSRNNPERTGAHSSADAPPPAAKLQFVAPTEFVELPSKGQGYPEGHPLCGEEVIEIRFMTAKEEDILSSETLLKKGIAIERFMQSVIIDKRIKTDGLLVGDRNAIIIAARKSGYGALYETKVNCPNCGQSNELVFDLNNPKIEESFVDEKYNITPTSRGTFMVKCPLSKFNVELRLLTGRDENALTTLVKNRSKKKQQEAHISDQLKLMIVSVEGQDDRSTINMYANNMPTQDSRYIRQAYKAISPNVRVTEDFECASCSHEQELEVPFGADFFWPER